MIRVQTTKDQQRSRRRRRRQDEAGEPEAASVALEHAAGGPLRQASLQGSAAASLRAGAVQRIQGAAGNQAVGHFLVQRATERANEPPAAWNMPFDLGTASDRATARMGITLIIDRLDSLAELLNETDAKEIKGTIKNLAIARGRLAAAGPLTTQDLADLSVITLLVQSSYSAKMDAAKQRFVQALDNFNARDTSEEEAAIADDLHQAFLEGANDRIGALKDSLGKLKSYADNAKKVGEWAKKVATAAQAAGTVEALGKAVGAAEGTSKVLGQMGEVLNVARTFATIAGFDNQKAGEVQNDINRFQAGLNAIDIAMGFAKSVPLLGMLWSKYYKPLTENILKGLSKIARLREKEGKTMALLEFGPPTEPGKAPRIGRGLEQFFPGGQAVLDFMYPLLNGGTPAITSEVEQFFLKYIKQLNVGMPESEQLQKKSQWHWYNPFTWGAPATAPNLMEWAEKNKEMLWAMLYGNLPYKLG